MDPGNVENPFDDKELMFALDEKLKFDPDAKIPEGFKKKVEKVPVYEFRIPDFIRQHQDESQIIAIETMDEILYDAFGTHFLEP